MKEIIEESRKKREDFLNRIVEIDTREKGMRKSRTPKNLAKVEETKHEKKSKTPRASSFQKNPVKLFRAKSSLG